jgi:hypothetical protein
MNRCARSLALVLAFIALVLCARPAAADVKTKGAQELAEWLLQRSGRQAAKEGVQMLTRRIEQLALRHADAPVLRAIAKIGPRGITLIEEAGSNGSKVARLLAQYGERGAACVVERPSAMRLFLQGGDQVAAALCKHPGIAEPLIERGGAQAAAALNALTPQSGRRLAMLAAEGGELAQLTRNPRILTLLGKGGTGDTVCDFLWRNRTVLALSGVATSVALTPDLYVNGAKHLADLVATNGIKPLAEVPGIVAREGTAEVARGTNWTVVFSVGVLALTALAAARWRLFRRLVPATMRRDTHPPQECRP